MLNRGTKGPVSADKLWQFSLLLYPKVKLLCLQWQDEFGANVNLLLLLCYLEQHQLSLNSTELALLINQLDNFSAQFTRPLRAMRRRSGTAAVTPAQQQILTQALLQAELTLEQLEQQLLLQHCPQLTHQAAPMLELYLAKLNADANSLAAQIIDLRQVCRDLSQHGA